MRASLREGGWAAWVVEQGTTSSRVRTGDVIPFYTSSPTYLRRSGRPERDGIARAGGRDGGCCGRNVECADVEDGADAGRRAGGACELYQENVYFDGSEMVFPADVSASELSEHPDIASGVVRHGWKRDRHAAWRRSEKSERMPGYGRGGKRGVGSVSTTNASRDADTERAVRRIDAAATAADAGARLERALGRVIGIWLVAGERQPLYGSDAPPTAGEIKLSRSRPAPDYRCAVRIVQLPVHNESVPVADG